MTYEYLITVEHDTAGSLVPDTVLGATVISGPIQDYSVACVCPECGRYWLRLTYYELEEEFPCPWIVSADCCDLHSGGSIFFNYYSPWRKPLLRGEAPEYSELIAAALKVELQLPIPFYDLRYGKQSPYIRRRK